MVQLELITAYKTTKGEIKTNKIKKGYYGGRIVSTLPIFEAMQQQCVMFSPGTNISGAC